MKVAQNIHELAIHVAYDEVRAEHPDWTMPEAAAGALERLHDREARKEAECRYAPAPPPRRPRRQKVFSEAELPTKTLEALREIASERPRR